MNYFGVEVSTKVISFQKPMLANLKGQKFSKMKKAKRQMNSRCFVFSLFGCGFVWACIIRGVDEVLCMC